MLRHPNHLLLTTPLLIAIAASLLAGCGGTSSSDEADAATEAAAEPEAGTPDAKSEDPVAPEASIPVCDPPAGAQQFIEQLAAVLCDGFVPCCTSAGFTYDAAACKQQVVSKYTSALSGSCATLDSATAATCIEKMKEVGKSCSTGWFEREVSAAACSGVFHGSSPLGGPCNTGFDCARQGETIGRCVFEAGQGGGVCRPTNFSQQLGEP